MDIVDQLIKNKILHTDQIINAFKEVDRSFFLPEDQVRYSYEDRPLPIGYGQTNSQPSTVAFMLELLQPQVGHKILDIVCGSGWTTALLSCITGKNGRVYGIELIPELSEISSFNIKNAGNNLANNVEIFNCDGKNGYPDESYFDRILISAATDFYPETVLGQLTESGKMVFPLGRQSSIQDIVLMEKQHDGNFKKTAYPGFAFVPLI
jgi:protein-L-isoaspartate(D-aspartate) O-methyltransferase